MDLDKRPVHKIVAEIKSYNNRLSTMERIEDLQILSEELGPNYNVKWWLFNKHLRVAVINKDGYQL